MVGTRLIRIAAESRNLSRSLLTTDHYSALFPWEVRRALLPLRKLEDRKCSSVSESFRKAANMNTYAPHLELAPTLTMKKPHVFGLLLRAPIRVTVEVQDRTHCDRNSEKRTFISEPGIVYQ